MIQTRKLRASWRLPGCGARADGRTTLHALGSLEARGSLFTDPQTEVYAGMLVRARRRRRPCLVTLQLGVPLARPCSRCWGPPDAAGGAGAARVFTCPREAVQLARLSRQERSNHGKHCLSRRRMMASLLALLCWASAHSGSVDGRRAGFTPCLGSRMAHSGSVDGRRAGFTPCLGSRMRAPPPCAGGRGGGCGCCAE